LRHLTVAGPERINLASTTRAAARAPLTEGQGAPTNFIEYCRGDAAVDALVFEFMGLAMLALCVVVMAVPSGRRQSGRIGHS
jgi:hypothetical protein